MRCCCSATVGERSSGPSNRNAHSGVTEVNRAVGTTTEHGRCVQRNCVAHSGNNTSAAAAASWMGRAACFISSLSSPDARKQTYLYVLYSTVLRYPVPVRTVPVVQYCTRSTRNQYMRSITYCHYVRHIQNVMLLLLTDCVDESSVAPTRIGFFALYATFL